LCGSALVLRLAVAVPLAIAMIAGVPRLGLEHETADGMRIAALLGIAGVAYGCLGSSFRSRPAWIPTILIVETAWHGVQLIASWMWLRVSPGTDVSTLVAIATAVQLLQIATALVFWRRLIRDPIRLPDVRMVRRTLARAVPFAAAGLVANLQTRLAPLMLGYLSTQADLGAFAAAAKFGTTARLAPGAIFAGALPVLSHEHGRGDDEARRAFVSFDRTFGVLALGTAAALIVARPLLWRVYGQTFAAASPVLVWIAFGLVPGLTNSATKIALYAAGAERAAVAWSAVSLAVQGATAVALIPAWGAVGAAASAAIGEAIIWLPLRRARRRLRTSSLSSPRREPAPTLGPLPQAAVDVADPAEA